MSLRILLAAIAGLLFAGSARAQLDFPAAYSQSTWTTEEGLPQNSVVGIAEDQQGYLWLATFGGLARFDGVTFEHFDPGNREDLTISRFNRIFSTSDGSIWAGTFGSGVVRFHDGRFTTHELPMPVNTITQDGDGVIWSTGRHGLHRWNGTEFQRATVGLDFCLGTTRDGALWASSQEGLKRLVLGQWTTMGEDVGLPERIYSAIAQAYDGRLWVACNPGLYVSTDSTHSEFLAVPNSPSRIRSMEFDGNGSLWTLGEEGLNCWDLDLGTGLPLGDVHSNFLHVDSSGAVWVGSLGDGLSCFRRSPLQDPARALGIDPGNAWTVDCDGNGRVYVGTTRKLVSAHQGVVRSLGTDGRITAIMSDSRGGLWNSTPKTIRYRSEGLTREYRVSGHEQGEPRVVLEAEGGRIWVGTTEGLFHLGDDCLERVIPEVLSASCLLEAPSGTLWVGGAAGVARITGGHLKWFTAENGLAPGVVRTLYRDPDGVLWVGSYGGGISRIAGESVFRFSRKQGLVDDFISCILEDDDGRLWINSNAGPFVVRREDLNRVASGDASRVHCVSFTKAEGAREANGGYQSSGCRTPDGRIWFPTIVGVTVADPRLLPIGEAPPRPIIKSLALNEDRQLDVIFTALGSSSPSQVLIQYQLDGADERWVDALEERHVRYDQVRPGERQFRLRARSGYGPWSEVLETPVSVPARFFEGTSFFILVVLGSCLITFSMVRGGLGRARRRATELAQLVGEREQANASLSRNRGELTRLSHALLTSQDSERSLLSSELHDDITQRLAALVIQGELVEQELDSNTDAAHGHLEEIIRMAQRLTEDVQQLSRRLHPSGLRMLGLPGAIKSECEAFTRRNGTAVEVHVDATVTPFDTPTATAIFRILQESLHNIEKHARARSIAVSLELTAGEFQLSIADQGRGFDSDVGSNTGLGLITMNERAASIGAELGVTSELGVGTTVDLRGPIPGTPS